MQTKIDLYMQPATPNTGILLKRERIHKEDPEIVGIYNSQEKKIVLATGLDPDRFRFPDPVHGFQVEEFNMQFANQFYNQRLIQ